ncbi:MAG: RluA family pseudouridine synthase [Candidatus Eisenbacteria bacterium]
MSEIFKETVPHCADGERIDHVIPSLVPRLTRSQAQRLVRQGSVTLNGKVVKCSHRVRRGDELAVCIPEPEKSHLEPEHIPLHVVFEDRDIVVVNKPAGLVVHPGAGVKSGTLVNALLAHCEGLSSVGGVVRPGIVHRLDKGTSGLLVVAKTDAAHVRLSAQIAQRKVTRKYCLVAWGQLDRDSGRIEAPISRHRTQRKRMAVDWRRGKEAVTVFTVLERFSFATYVQAALETGRTHQIRVHFSSGGHPVFGDAQYGGRTRALSRLAGTERNRALRLLKLIDRPALHAAVLGFEHPITGGTLSFEAPLPSDMLGLLEALRRGL